MLPYKNLALPKEEGGWENFFCSSQSESVMRNEVKVRDKEKGAVT